ncbi:MAG: S8 family serine peptidase [Candidatus Lokiarchaeota archaeon]|nr:S8 family serine peptidase [Candidatus Lokiarchaeota archaeon]
MKKFNDLTRLTILILILFINSLVFIEGYRNHITNNNSQNNAALQKIDNLSKSNNNFIQDTQKINLDIFDSGLKAYFSGKYDIEEKISIIIIFNSEVPKKERTLIINSLFDDIKITSNFNIVPGIALVCNSKELYDKATIIGTKGSIQKIFKTKFYKLFDNEEFQDNLNLAQLDEQDYSNWWISAIGADNIEYNGAGVRVAVIDSGVYDHPDLNYDPLFDARNFAANEINDHVINPDEIEDKNGHGTHCAGIIGSSGASSQGIYRGVAPGVTIVNAKAGNIVGSLDEESIINAIEWSVNPILGDADVISMSFGGGYPEAGDPISLAVQNATRQGVVCVASAGNSGPDFFTGGTPGAGISEIAIGATNINNQLASFSSRGPTFSYLGFPDVVAPGVNIISTMAPDTVLAKRQIFLSDYFDFTENADYMPLSGTSMACPMVAGAAAILKEAYPSINPEAIRIALLEGAKKLSNQTDARSLYSGAGLINVSASLEYLKTLQEIHGSVNSTVKAFPDVLPVKPFDLLQFPGDKQEFNITVISAINDAFTIDIPTENDDGVVFSIDRDVLNFTQRGVNFTTLLVSIKNDAIPGPRIYYINISNGAGINTTVSFSINVSLPEHRILMESYHGLNDMFFVDSPSGVPMAKTSYYQMGFYEAMSDISARNISIDYLAEFWTPNYDKNTNNSFITTEKLSQYDLVILQNPILPYSTSEIESISEYYSEGGNLLFLGTRYEDMCLESINLLLSRLDSGIQFNTESISDLNRAGFFSTIGNYDVINFSLTNPIVQDISNIYWETGSTLQVNDILADSLATNEGRDVIAVHDGGSQNGNIVVFGSLDWMYYDYKNSDYQNDHNLLLNNLLDYFFPSNDISLNIKLASERISTEDLDITLYIKNQTSETPINGTDFTSLGVTVQNDGYSSIIQMNITKDSYGIYFNNTFTLPNPSPLPYNIMASVLINGQFFNKSTKILFFNDTKIPLINALTLSDNNSFRSGHLEINTNTSIESVVKGYTSLIPGSLLSTRPLLEQTFNLTYLSGSYSYGYNLNLLNSYPAGIGTTFVVSKSLDNYTNPYSPRISFEILNSDPEIDSSNSYIDGRSVSVIEDSSYLSAIQGSQLFFEIAASDVEDIRANLTVSITLFMCSVHFLSSSSGVAVEIFPSILETATLEYNSTSNKFELYYTVPSTMIYSTIEGLKSISTKTDYQRGGDYVGRIYITVTDTDGGFNNGYDSDNYLSLLIIINEPSKTTDPIVILMYLIIIVAIIGIIIFLIAISSQHQRKKSFHHQQEYFRPDYSNGEPHLGEYYSEKIPLDKNYHRLKYCGYCGSPLTNSDLICKNCGHSIETDNE